MNGIPVTPTASWSVTVPLAPAAVFNRIDVVGLLSGGKLLRETATLVVGDVVTTGFVLDGDHTPDGVALRISDLGLAQIAPIVESLSTDALDISGLITDQNPIAQGSMSGISYTANAVEVGFGGFGLAAVPTAGGIDATITIDDFYIEVDLDLGGILGSCTLEMQAASSAIQGSYDLAPLASDPTHVDVNLVSPTSVVLGGFSSQFVSGICDDLLIGDIVNLIIGQGDIQQLMQDGFQDGGSSSSQDVEFSGSGGAVVQGTTSVHVELDFSLALEAFSNSNTAFPTANGDEMAIRLGKNDTIDNNFTAGQYPGMGNRNIADDGHKVSITLTSTPLP